MTHSREGAGPRPIIGITAYEEQAHWNQWDDRAALLPATYVRSIEQAGGIPVLIPVQDLSQVDARRLVDRFDGIILTGGPDVDPDRYGAEPHAETSAPRKERDALEEAVCSAAAAARPLLAICRGLQVLNVARGGTLHQHLPDVVGHDSHAPVKDGYGNHEVRIAAGSLLSTIVGVNAAGVPTHHHQAIDKVGEGLTVVAYADDGTIEAVEDEGARFLIGVQWHPEAGTDPSLFEGLVHAAAGFAAARGGRGEDEPVVPASGVAR